MAKIDWPPAAGCVVGHAIEDRVAGVFIHFVRLADV
jgi:hypothetical protein